MNKIEEIIKFDKSKLKAVYVNGKYYLYDKVKYTNREYNNKYNFTKIYKISSPQTNKIYIGSTCKKYLSSRLSNHKFEYSQRMLKKNYCSSFEIVKFDDCIIELIELCNFNDTFDKQAREKHYIQLYKDICVNKYLIN